MQASPVWLFTSESHRQDEERIPVWVYDGSIVLPAFREVSAESPEAVSWKPGVGQESFPAAVRWTYRRPGEYFPGACLDGCEHDWEDFPDFDELDQPVGTSFICGVCGCSGDST